MLSQGGGLSQARGVHWIPRGTAFCHCGMYLVFFAGHRADNTHDFILIPRIVIHYKILNCTLLIVEQSGVWSRLDVEFFVLQLQ